MPTTVLSRQRVWIAILAVLAMVASLMAIATPAQAAVIDISQTCPSTTPSAGFTDISGLPADNQLAINCIAAYGITQGTGGNLYTPLGNVPRWQMALFLTRELTVHGVTLPATPAAPFADIGGHNAETQLAINQLAELDISVGRTATTFVPDDDVTREEMALFIARKLVVAGVTLADPPASGGFTDIATLSAEAQKAINQLENAGVVQGVGQNKYAPSVSILRANMAFFEARALATDGILPPGLGFTDMPELLAVSEESYDADEDELVLVYTFDETIDFVDEKGNFRVYQADHSGFEAGDSTSVNGNQVTVTFEDITGSEYNDLTVATVAQEAVEDLDGDANPEGSAPYKASVIGASSGELGTGFNLLSVTHDDSGSSDGTANFIFQYDDDVVAADAALLGGFVIYRDDLTFEVCDFFEDSVADDDLDDDELMIECDSQIIPSDEWVRGLDTGGVIIFPPALGPDMFQADDEASTDTPDLVGIEQVGDVRVEFSFDERLSLPDDGDPGDPVDSSDDVDYDGDLDDFGIYDDEGNVVYPIELLVTDSDRVVRAEFDPADLDGFFGDEDDDLDGDLEGGFVVSGAVRERSGDEESNVRDEVRTAAGDDVSVPAGVTAGADLVSVGDIEVSDTDISGDASEWEVVFTFSTDVSEAAADCDDDDAELFRIYAVDGSLVEGDTCDVDDEEVTITFGDSDVEDGVLGGVAFNAIEADDNGQPNVEGSGPTKFAG